MATIAINGIDKVLKNLQQLNEFPKVQKQLVQTAGRAALRPTVKAMRAAAPRSNKKTFSSNGKPRKSGDLRRSIGTKSARRSPTVIAGPRESSRFVGFYGKMVEYGTANRTTKKGYNRGRLGGINRMMPAAQSTRSQVMRIYVNNVRLAFDKYAKKVGLR